MEKIKVFSRTFHVGDEKGRAKTLSLLEEEVSSFTTAKNPHSETGGVHTLSATQWFQSGDTHVTITAVIEYETNE